MSNLSRLIKQKYSACELAKQPGEQTTQLLKLVYNRIMSPILDPNTIEIFSRGPEQTRRVGMRLGALLIPGDVVLLDGDLGAGKTTLTQGLASGWGSIDPVTSPTFVLINTYNHPSRTETLFHLDAYRLASAAEAFDLDIDLMVDSGILIVEWGDRIKQSLPSQLIRIELEWLEPEHRTLRISGQGKRAENLLKNIRKDVFGIR